MFTVTPKQARGEVIRCIQTGHVALLTSSPGMGKSSLVRQIAKDFNLKLIDIRLSQCTPEDLNGFPMRMGDKAQFVPFDIFPLEGDEIPEGYDGWLIFCDELTSATKPVQAAAYKLLLDKMVGSFKLHPAVAMVAAGNKATDKAVVNTMSTALQSRVIHYELALDRDEFNELAINLDFDHRIRGFLNYSPKKIMDFRPDHQEKTFPCPRTWEFLSDLIKGDEVSPSIGARIAGCVGEGTATEFITFAQEYDRLPKFEDVVDNPTGTPVPPEGSTKWATISTLIENFTEDTIKPVIEYVQRFGTEFQIIFGRGAVVKDPAIRHQEDFSKYLTTMVRYLQ